MLYSDSVGLELHVTGTWTCPLCEQDFEDMTTGWRERHYRRCQQQREAAYCKGLQEAIRAVLLFHGPGPWDMDKRMEWGRLTGHAEATTKALCDFLRERLGGEEAN